jgi:hypothetical protein
MNEKLFIIGEIKGSKWEDLTDPSSKYYVEDVVNSSIHFIEGAILGKTIDELLDGQSIRSVGYNMLKRILSFIDPRKLVLKAFNNEYEVDKL